MNHPDMNAAIVLVRVADAGSFRGAAKLLGMPKSSVSRKVAELEARLGVQLLRRTTRHVGLTDAGLAYVDAAQTAIAILEAGEEAVTMQQREPRGRVRLTAPAPLGHSMVTPIVSEFLRQCPKVEVQLHLTNRPVDLLVERFDIAFRFGALPDSSLRAIQLCAAKHQIVASPSYLKAYGTPMTPADLSEHECLLFGSDSPSLRAKWTLVAKTRTTDVPVRGRFAVDDLLALRAAALSGLGIARLPAPVIAQDVKTGALVPVLADYGSVVTPLFLVHPGGRYLPARTRALIDLFVERLGGPRQAS